MSRRSISRRIFGYFIRGVFLVVPITLIVYVIFSLFTFLDELLPTIFPQLAEMPGLGLISLILGITFLGYLGSSFIAEPIYARANKLLDRVPLIKTIYTAITDLLSAFVGQKKSFSKPVLVKMNKSADVEKIGFITAEDLSRLQIGSGKIAVYLPHSYAFSGNLFIVPIENVTPIEGSTPEIMKFIVSGGVTEVGEREE